MKKLFQSTVLLVLSFAAAKADDNAAQLLNYKNPIKEVGKYAAGTSPEEKLKSRQNYQDSLMKSKASSMAMCEEAYTGEQFISCQNKVDYAYLVLENLPNVIDRMEYQGVQSVELKTQAEIEARKFAFSFVKSAFSSEANNS